MPRRLTPGYRIERLGNALLDENGEQRSVSLGRVEAFIKDRDPATYGIANEYICARLGAAIGVPTPPGDFAQIRDSEKVCWVSPLLPTETPPPPDISDMCSKEPKAAAGTLVFDAWIANGDRNEFNIIYSQRHGLTLIDHEQPCSTRAPIRQTPYVKQSIPR